MQFFFPSHHEVIVWSVTVAKTYVFFCQSNPFNLQQQLVPAGPQQDAKALRLGTAPPCWWHRPWCQPPTWRRCGNNTTKRRRRNNYHSMTIQPRPIQHGSWATTSESGQNQDNRSTTSYSESGRLGRDIRSRINSVQQPQLGNDIRFRNQCFGSIFLSSSPPLIIHHQHAALHCSKDIRSATGAGAGAAAAAEQQLAASPTATTTTPKPPGGDGWLTGEGQCPTSISTQSTTTTTTTTTNSSRPAWTLVSPPRGISSSNDSWATTSESGQHSAWPLGRPPREPTTTAS